MKHADMPDCIAMDGSPHSPTSAMSEWQAAHEPFLSVRVWVSDDRRMVTRVEWSTEIQGQGVMEKPLEDMMAVIQALRENLANVQEGAVQAVMARKLLGALKGNN